MLLWALTDHAAMPERFRKALSDPAAEQYLSTVTVWELTIKRRIGKLTFPPDLFDKALAAGCIAVPVTWAHALATYDLPLHHGDPFDRMLIAQARVEGLTLMSADRVFQRYDVNLF